MCVRFGGAKGDGNLIGGREKACEGRDEDFFRGLAEKRNQHFPRVGMAETTARGHAYFIWCHLWVGTLSFVFCSGALLLICVCLVVWCL